MKRFALFAGVLVLTVWMLDAIPVDSDSSESGSGESDEDWPAQEQCPGVKALKFKPTNLPTTAAFKLYVGRIMTSPYTPVEDPTGPNNLCSPLSYVIDSCQGTEIYVKINSDGSKVVKMAAYNKITNNAACYTQTAEQQEPKYHIFKAKVNQMALIDDKGEIHEVPTIPGEVLKLEETMITTLKYGKDLAYAIYSSCLKNAVWVAYAERVVKENLIDSLKAEVDQALTDLGFEPSKFVDVPTSIPINLDKCFVEATVPVAV
ncbi:uncharacterized protein LOC135849277 [Planococcus citri]|uniref:uncharacterized protein LOC135849277 n=1 Tax=Planococcus citri TaxID=170843 RepID=UPI0031F8A0F4